MKLATVLAFAIILCVITSIVLSDTIWCIENYGIDVDIIHCLHYENNLYGKFIQP